MRTIFFVIITGALFTLFYGCATVHDYEPKSQDEVEIKAFLVDMETKWKNIDKPGYLSLMSDDAKIMMGGDRKIISKAEYAKLLPDRMKEIGPMKFGTPEINVTGNTAIVNLSLSVRNRTRPFTLNLLRIQDRWMLQSSSY